ncbi:MAG: hypothetical protein ACOZCL_18140 [Bacillota bacterium]
MNNERIYFYNGDVLKSKQQLNLNEKKAVVIKDIDTEICIDDVKNIEIEIRHEGKIALSLTSKATITFENKRIVIHDREKAVLIAVINSEEEMQKYNDIISKHNYYELVDYIMEYSPNLFEKEKLEQMTIEELQEIKEKVFELANSY